MQKYAYIKFFAGGYFMLEQFIKGYAEAQDFPAEVINDVMNSDSDQGYYFLEFERALCSLKEIDSLGFRKALVIVTLQTDELNKSFEEEALLLCRRLEDNRQNLCNAICCPSASEQKLSFFTLINLTDISQEEFNQKLNNLAAMCKYYYTGLRTAIADTSIKAQAYADIDKLLLSANIDPKQLYDNFNRLQFNEQAVLFKLNPYNKTIILKSLLGSELPLSRLQEIAFNNLKLQGEFFFTFDKHNLYFNTLIDAHRSSAENLMKMLTAHLKLIKELKAHYADCIAPANNDSLLSNFANFILA